MGQIDVSIGLLFAFGALGPNDGPRLRLDDASAHRRGNFGAMRRRPGRCLTFGTAVETARRQDRRAFVVIQDFSHDNGVSIDPAAKLFGRFGRRELLGLDAHFGNDRAGYDGIDHLVLSGIIQDPDDVVLGESPDPRVAGVIVKCDDSDPVDIDHRGFRRQNDFFSITVAGGGEQDKQ